MVVDTSKETGYIVQSTIPTDEIVVTKENAYVAQSFYPIDELMVMKQNCYVVMAPSPVFTSVGLITFSGQVSMLGKIRFTSL